MRRFFKALSAALLLAAVCVNAFGAEVRVFEPVEGEVSATSLRGQALLSGFAAAVGQEADKLLPAAMSEARTALVKEYLDEKANLFVLGYKELASNPSPEGLGLILDVTVNRRALRETLTAMGVYATAGHTQPFSLLPTGGLLEEDLSSMTRLVQLTGLAQTPGVQPELTLGRDADGVLTGVLRSPVGNWSAMDADLETVWFAVWSGYFTRQDAAYQQVGSEILSVSGWFTPDGVNVFDEMLRSWETELRSVELVDMVLDSAGVSARWEVAVSNRSALMTRLEEHLPPRGLSYTLTKAAR